MSIAFNSYAGANTGSPATSLSTTSTAAGSNRLAVIAIRADGTTASNAITAMTYDSVTCTQIGSFTFGTNDRVWLYYILNPNTTAGATVSVTLNVTRTMNIRVATYTGVKQSAQPDASATNTVSSTTTLSATVTSTVNNCWHVAVLRNDQGVFNVTVGTDRSAGDAITIADSNASISPAGSNTITGSWTGTGSGGYYSASFAPAVSATSTNPTFLLNFV